MKRQPTFSAAVPVCVAAVLTGPAHAATLAAAGKFGVWDYLEFVGLVVLVVGYVTFLVLFERRRSNKIQAIARSLGLPFRKKPTEADNALITGCHLDRTRPITAGKAVASIASTLIFGDDMLAHNDFTNVVEVAQTEELRLTVFDLESSYGSGKSRRSSYYTVSRAQSPLFELPMPELRQFLEQPSPLTIEGNRDLVFLYADRRIKTKDYAQFIEQTKRSISLILEGQRSQPAT